MKQKILEIKSSIPVIGRGTGLIKPKKVKPKKAKKDHIYVTTLKAMKPGQCFDVPCTNPISKVRTLYSYYSSRRYYISNPVYTTIKYYADKFLKDMHMRSSHKIVIRGILQDKCYRVWLISK